MSRLIFVPQYPAHLRYQEWWFTEFPKQFGKYFDEVITIGSKFIHDQIRSPYEDPQNFSPIKKAIEFECAQIQEYMDLDLQWDDVLFYSDLSFAGIFGNVLYHKRPLKIYSYCHATSRNYLDYFAKHTNTKWLSECGFGELSNTVFVGSHYHKEKLNGLKSEVVRLPKPPVIVPHECERDKDFISVSRPTPQKYSPAIEGICEQEFGPIQRCDCNTWEDYSGFLSSSKALVISTQEDTFNYTIMDAIICGCIPIAPNYMCFPEILPREYLYKSEKEFRDIIHRVMDGSLQAPTEMLCEYECNNFYRIVSEWMKV